MRRLKATQALFDGVKAAFRNHGDTLLFASTNEVMVDGNYNPPTAEYCSVQKGFNQAFITAVRGTGVNNANRHLVVQARDTNIDHAISCNALCTGTMAILATTNPACSTVRPARKAFRT